ncbi:hypothetical protein EJ08DRAFT_587037 [Tothia fuscella]|uniref:Uncharacterized protein n=1 Tax=Tothia fuscella TaxID=1048955 RepID=A0A9P4NSX4_9PEZI|nr:hypothetical protein EJ08DRAFT_587037 [Tothia fuscella]
MATPSTPAKIDRQTTTPFLLKLFYRTGSHTRIEDFHPQGPSPPHVQIYTWMSCNVGELGKLIADNLSQLLPDPYIGTRLDFELIYPDMRAPARQDGSGRYMKKPLGSIVLGAGSSAGVNGTRDEYEEDNTPRRRDVPPTGDEEKSLLDAKFVIGDFIDCAIYPPLANGEVAPLPRSTAGILGGRNGPPPRENGFGGPPYGGRPRGPSGRGGGFDGLPPGEWRRGDALPSGGGGGGGGYGGRGRGRGRGW